MNEPTRGCVGVQDVRFGERVTIVEPVNLYGCTLADEVFIGPFVEIQANVSIGRGTRIQSHSFICEQVTIGERCFIGHGVMFANDLFQGGVPDPDSANWGHTVIDDEVSIGSNATIIAGADLQGHRHRGWRRGDPRHHHPRHLCRQSGQAAARLLARRRRPHPKPGFPQV
ncbi:N-acetyltransferase [Aeromonas intestinalis]